MPNKQCIDCNTDLIGRERKRCLNCNKKIKLDRNRLRYHKNKPKHTDFICVECHVEFKLDKSRQRFCSDCYIIRQQKANRKFKEKLKIPFNPIFVCLECKKTFERNITDTSHRQCICSLCKPIRARISIKRWNMENIDQLRKINRLYENNRLLTDPLFKIKKNCRIRTSIAIKTGGYTKRSQTHKLLGCSWEFLLDWLKYQFTGNMTMDNYGTVWHIDHCVPCSLFDLSIDSERFICFHWSNLQPMYANKNLSKGNNTTMWEQVMQQLKEKTYITKNKHTNTQYTLVRFDREDYLN
jgi:hypothetical protein